MGEKFGLAYRQHVLATAQAVLEEKRTVVTPIVIKEISLKSFLAKATLTMSILRQTGATQRAKKSGRQRTVFAPQRGDTRKPGQRPG